MNRPILFWAVWAFGLSCCSSAFAQGDAQFAKANQEYAAGHFKEAVDAYEQAVRSGDVSANIFYDLGNAYFHTADFGRAILNYERALALDRHHPEAQANLRFARDEARALEITLPTPTRFAEVATVNQYAISAAIGFWIAIFCFAGWMFSNRRSGRTVAVSILALLVCASAIAGIFLVENGNKGRGLAVVTGRDVTARLATADSAQSVLGLPSGSEVRILSERGDWVFAVLPSDLRGWIQTKDVEPVRL